MIGYFKPCFAEWQSFSRVRWERVDATSIVVDFFRKMLPFCAEQFNMHGFPLSDWLYSGA